MTRDEILAAASMPAVRPMYPHGPYYMYDRAYLIIAYQTSPDAIRAALPEPLQPDGDRVAVQWVDIPDATGFGAYDACAVAIPCTLKGHPCTFIAQMYVNNSPPLSGGREIWGYPMKYAQSKLSVMGDTLTGTLDYAGVRVATGTMTYKHEKGHLEHGGVAAMIARTQVNLKFIPHVDGTPAIAQLTAYEFQDIKVKGAWRGQARLDLIPSANAPLADFPVLGKIEGTNLVTDLTLPYARVVHDYLG